MKPVLVTGATGMIGGAVARALLGEGRPVRVLSRRADAAVPTGAESCVTTRLDELAKALGGAEAVVHCAGALSTASGFSRSGGPDLGGTEALTKALIAEALRADVQKFVLVSSTAVYGPGKAEAADEYQALRPVSAYGWSKLRQEKHLFGAAGRMSAVVLRPSIVSGPGDRHFAASLKRLSRLPAFVVPSRSQRFDIAHCDDVAALAVLALDRAADGNVFNATSGFTTDLAEIAVAVAGSKRVWQAPVSLFRAAAAVLSRLISPFDLEAAALLGPIGRAYLFDGGGQFSIQRARSELGFAPPQRKLGDFTNVMRPEQGRDQRDAKSGRCDAPRSRSAKRPRRFPHA